MAVRRGTVSGNFWNDTRGWVITIDHVSDDGEKFRTLYQHLKQQSPHKVGAELNAGTVIGIMGASTKTIVGMAVHLHMETQIIVSDKWTPIDFMWQLKHVEAEMTKEQVKEIVKEVLAESKDDPSAWADAWPMAARDGITDGKGPQAFCTREQVVQLIYRAIGKVKRLNREASDGSN
jgi:murein DD-endopeptidase MepM/ murein hydrolase activator NlpD